MPRPRYVAFGFVLAAPLACSEPSAPTSVGTYQPAGPRFDLVTTEIERTVTAEEFAAADVEESIGICVKGTSSTNLLMKDANAATPSQPCPPAWQFIGKPQGIKINKEWFTEDKNQNGTVCVKFVGESKKIIKDDNANTPSQPCPPSYSPVSERAPTGPAAEAEDIAAADDDGDGLVCVNALASGNFIARDDNDAITPSQPCPPAWYVVGAKASGGGGGAEPAEPAQPAV